MSPDRLAAAAAVLVSYGLMCAAILRAHRQRARAAEARARSLARSPDPVSTTAPAAPAQPPLRVAHAGQSGQAEALATQAAQALHAAGRPVTLLTLGALQAPALRDGGPLLIVASTAGEGDPPDNAAAFAQDVMAHRPRPDLQGLDYAVLALGDRRYARYCAFGHALDTWLAECGAHRLFPRIDVDAGDPSALAAWQRQLQTLGAAPTEPAHPAPTAAPFQPWRIVQRRHLNPGSAGGPCFHLELEPAEGPPPHWEPGDLLQLHVPEEPGRPRDYTIASVPADGRVHLLVRQQGRADGRSGLASGWLTRHTAPGDTLPMRVRAHAGFRIGGNRTRPLVLIGNGTGLAGLRAHLRARAGHPASGQPAAPAWLLYGERSAAHDDHYAEELAQWQASGLLRELDRVYSRDTPQQPYVQHRLRERAPRLRQWLEAGAAIYVCGSRQGMGQAVHGVLEELLGHAGLQALSAAGRYRRDLY
ncbi:MAG: hypothetical protein RLY78_2816 [Pseudomonadota bacterium]